MKLLHDTSRQARQAADEVICSFAHSMYIMSSMVEQLMNIHSAWFPGYVEVQLLNDISLKHGCSSLACFSGFTQLVEFRLNGFPAAARLTLGTSHCLIHCDFLGFQHPVEEFCIKVVHTRQQI